MKVLIINGNSQYSTMFREEGWGIVETLREADLVQFTGGEDVSPSLYGEQVHPRTGHNPRRDKFEMEVFKEALDMGIPMAGICRGGQFLNVMCGGKMWQHVDGHAIYGTHACIDMITGEQVQVTSTHHQMMLAGALGNVIGRAYESTYAQYMDGDAVRETTLNSDTEVVHYPDHKVLCFQPHPEYGVTSCKDYYFRLLGRHLELSNE